MELSFYAGSMICRRDLNNERKKHTIYVVRRPISLIGKELESKKLSF